jgi:hypothetical protein
MTISSKIWVGAPRICALAVLAAGLCGWEEYDNRTEFVTRGAGDAVEVNKVTQTINPWPRYVKNRKFVLDGKRAGIAMYRYQTNQVLRPRPLNPVKAPEMPVADPGGGQLPQAQPQQ